MSGVPQGPGRPGRWADPGTGVPDLAARGVLHQPLAAGPCARLGPPRPSRPGGAPIGARGGIPSPSRRGLGPSRSRPETGKGVSNA